ncbi:hypothetical protein FAIPA1_70046 [Frankia sp. AiPs1]
MRSESRRRTIRAPTESSPKRAWPPGWRRRVRTCVPSGDPSGRHNGAASHHTPWLPRYPAGSCTRGTRDAGHASAPGRRLRTDPLNPGPPVARRDWGTIAFQDQGGSIAAREHDSSGSWHFGPDLMHMARSDEPLLSPRRAPWRRPTLPRLRPGWIAGPAVSSAPGRGPSAHLTADVASSHRPPLAPASGSHGPPVGVSSLLRESSPGRPPRPDESGGSFVYGRTDWSRPVR